MNLPIQVLLRVVRCDEKGRPFGVPRNPRVPTIQEFNPRMESFAAGILEQLVVARRHGILPDQAERISKMSNDDLVAVRQEDPISATRVQGGLSLSGGHHRINEIIQRVRSGELDANAVIRILVHD